MRATRREKVFGPGRTVQLDRNAKCRIAAYARAWSACNRQGRQHKGPITRAFLEVLTALLWGFHNARTGICFPSYEAIAARAGCARSTVAEAVKVLEWAGVLTWQHRIIRVRERCTDLFGRISWRWRVIRTSNAYVFRDPKAADCRRFSSKSENPPGTQDQDILDAVPAPAHSPDSPLETALAARPLQQGMALNKAPAHRPERHDHQWSRRHGRGASTDTASPSGREEMAGRSGM
jgi:hypothetical protein